MNKLKIIIVLTGLTLFSYQNCQRSQVNNDNQKESSSDVGGANQPIDVVQLSQQNLEILKFFVTEVMQKINTSTSNTVGIAVQKKYSFDLSSLLLVETDLVSEDTLNKYCLTVDLKNELVAILNSSKVCKYGQKNQTDIVCSQVLQAPYAELVTAAEVFKLGYASDSCGSNMVVLCDDKNDELKKWISKVKSQLPQLKCTIN